MKAKIRRARGLFSLTKKSLKEFRSRARRSGAWYETLSLTERAIINITIKCVEKVRSPILGKAIGNIIGKLANTMRKTFIEKAKEIGIEMSKRMINIAQEWGNKDSSEWETNDGFIRFLGVIALNT